MEPWTLVAVVLLAVLTGAALPVIFEAHRTLREARRAIRRLDDSFGPAVDEFREATARVDRIARAVEPHADDVAEVLRSVAGLARPMRDLRENLVSAAALAGAVVPVLTAALRTFTSDPGVDAGPGTGPDESAVDDVAGHREEVGAPAGAADDLRD